MVMIAMVISKALSCKDCDGYGYFRCVLSVLYLLVGHTAIVN